MKFLYVALIWLSFYQLGFTQTKSLDPGTIGSGQTIKYNSVPEKLYQVSNPTGGIGYYNYQWQKSQDNVNWVNITNASQSVYFPNTLKENTYFRLRVKSGKFDSATNSILISVISQPVPVASLALQKINIITSSQSFKQLTDFRKADLNTLSQRQRVPEYTSGLGSAKNNLIPANSSHLITLPDNSRRRDDIGRRNPRFMSGTIGTSQTICYNNSPEPLMQISPASGGMRSYRYQWQSSADNRTWENIQDATGENYTPPALTSNTYYRRTVASGNYGSANSPSVLIRISPPITLAQLHDNASIENNTSTNIKIAISGGISPYTVNYTRNGIDQSPIENYPEGTPISTGVLSKNIYTYALTSVTDAAGCNAKSLGSNIIVTVTDNGNLAPGSIGASQSICYNSVPESLTQVSPPSGGSGNYTYQWQISPDNINWTNITGATLPSYSSPGLSASRYFRRSVKSGPYTPVYSNSILITVVPQITSAYLHDNMRIYENTAANLKVVISGGLSPYIIRYTQNGSNQTSLFNYTSGAAFSTGVLSHGSYFYELQSVTDAMGCSVTNLGSGISVVADEILTPGLIGNSQSICYNSVPGSLTQLNSPGGGTGIYSYQWQRSVDNINWSNITGATLSEFSSTELQVSTYFRRTVTSGSYPPVYSKSVLVTVYPEIPVAQLHDNISIYKNTSANFSVSITGGTPPYKINYSKDGVAQASIEGYSSGADIPTGLLTTGVYTYALTSVSDSRGCLVQNLGNSITVTVNEYLTAGTIGSSQLICSNSIPATLTQLTAPAGGNGIYTFQWQSSHDNSIWNDIAGATQQDYLPATLAVNTYYRRVVSSGIYPSVNSNVVYIAISPQITLAQLHDDISIFNNNSANFNINISGGTSPFTLIYRVNGSAQVPVTGYISGTNISTGILTTGIYTYTLSSVTDAAGCNSQNLGTPITVTVNNALLPGSIGTNQVVCNNSVATPLTELAAPSGGTGIYTYQWQSSHDNSSWSNIPGATLSGYSPGVLASSTYYRRTVNSGTYPSVNSNTVLITVSPEVTSAQLVDDARIFTNSSTTYSVIITGGASPFTVNYSRDGVSQPAILNYSSGDDISTGVLTTGSYTYTLVSVSDSRGCLAADLGTGITVTVDNILTPGSIGASQSICYNTVPSGLTQIIGASGGTGSYNYQWQSSNDNVTWTNISGATSSGYSPGTLVADKYFRRTVISGAYPPVYSNVVLVSVFTVAQLHDNLTIYNNTTANFNVAISGGTPPFNINYKRNGVTQTPISGYEGGTPVSMGLLSTGTYNYSLTSVTDATGCSAHSLGTDITVTVLSDQVILSNKALVVINSQSSSYSDYTLYIKPYLDYFGIPYDECNINTTSLPALSDYAVIIFGHKNVYSTGYPIAQLESAVSSGSGLYSFDPHLFDFASGFNTPTSQTTVTSNQINIPNYSHYITSAHEPDVYNTTNNLITLSDTWTVSQKSTLAGGTDLATMSNGGQTISLLQVTNYGNGRVVKWCGYDWVYEDLLGPVFGMDDLLWRGIVWAARKPFVMQGMPPMITMRVDDVTASDGGLTNNFEWVRISNEFGIIPWCGTYNNEIPPSYIPTLKGLIDADKATAFPHSFTDPDYFIFFNHNNLPTFDAAANTRAARDFYINNGLKLSNYLVPHYYEISSDALPEIKAMGADFIATHMLPDHFYFADPATPWINCGPYRIGRNGDASNEKPVSYAGYITLSGIQFFLCATEIRDDGGYEWYPDNDVVSTASRGIRQLRRAINSMVLPSLFTHETFFTTISADSYRQILTLITADMSRYNPEYTSTDYAVKYVRAKGNIKITNVQDSNITTLISYSGSNDMDTKCYLFTDQNGEISYRLIALPQVDGTNEVSVTK